MDKLKKLTLEELLELAKEIKYTPPSNDITTWTQQQVYHSALSVTVTQPVQIYAALLVCKTFPPLKIFFKSQIREYIKIYGNNN